MRGGRGGRFPRRAVGRVTLTSCSFAPCLGASAAGRDLESRSEAAEAMLDLCEGLARAGRQGLAIVSTSLAPKFEYDGGEASLSCHDVSCCRLCNPAVPSEGTAGCRWGLSCRIFEELHSGANAADLGHCAEGQRRLLKRGREA